MKKKDHYPDFETLDDLRCPCCGQIKVPEDGPKQYECSKCGQRHWEETECIHYKMPPWAIQDCPHCGGKGKPNEDEGPIDVGFSLPRYSVFCTSCGATGGRNVDPKEALRLWNERK